MRVPGIGRRGIRTGQARIRWRRGSAAWVVEDEWLHLQVAIDRARAMEKDGREVEVLPGEPEETQDDDAGRV